DVAELHLHGGRAVVAGVLAALAARPGLRLAEPGEFTRRAFDNGRLDLTEVEGLADLIAAETEAQRRQALRQMRGALGALCEGWRGRLVHALAYLEATIDFSDEDITVDLDGQVRPVLADLRTAISAHLDDGHRGERLRDGVRIAIVGPPNAGKSSLLNALARRDVAIVSETAGTTRDVIEVHLDLGGAPVIVADTAGLRDTVDAVEAEGVRRARARAAEADLRLLVLDATGPLDVSLDPGEGETLVLVNKVDLAPPGWAPPAGALALSVKTGAGLDHLLTALAERVGGAADAGAAALITRARHREALTETLAALDRCDGDGDPELLAEDLRLAARALGRIAGRVDVEDLLDVIFRDFCIGK
ncbi:MAG: tRNA uridine-5-carboxymethylaminomethyl(34) synthesis GTPase MnmE, partial [Rhodobacterales bacterium]|nr:tRNA uridine-5-carboxymethylaminomethyl(34) synthesis GTPase MnmE [Rhodobacterales bacterium]